MEETKENVKSKRKKKRGSLIVFGFTLISMLLQTVLTFKLLFETTAENKALARVTTIMFMIYVVAFALMVLFSIKQRKFEKESVSMYKGTMKWFKKIIKLLIVVISIVNILVASKVDTVALIGAVALLLFNLFLISLDIFIDGVKFKIQRKIKKRKRRKEGKTY